MPYPQHEEQCEAERDRAQNEPGAQVPALALQVHRTFHRCHFTTGGVSKLWYGGGLGRCVHSSVSAPSQGRSGAFSPLRIAFTTMYRNSNCDSPKPNAPSEEIMLKSANCSA